MFGRYSAPRPWLYILLWMVSAVELGLTAFRLHHTRSVGRFSEGSVIALLIVSILTLLWVPYAILTHRRLNRASNTANNKGLWHEASGGIPLWIFWLVAASIFTHKYPTRSFAALSGQKNIITTITALAWVAFSLLTIIKVLQLMHGAAVGAHGAHGRGGLVNDKAAVGPGAHAHNTNTVV